MSNKLLFLTLLILPTCLAIAQQPTDTQLQFFETNIRPALVKYCYDCHSVDAGDSRAGLLVDTRQGLLQGGDSGPALVPGNHTDSLIWEAINWDGYEMPPSQKMPSEVIAHFKTWIDMGAPDPRERELLEFKTKITADDIEKRRAHWAFQKPKKPNGDIDSLVLKRLTEKGLEPALQADAYTLLRRINFDIIGLPPTPLEIEAFVAAYERDADMAVRDKVNELLDRPQYGERWGRHWLDVARYAESSGSRNTPYPHAWRYPNYVIDSFNTNTPYDQFVKEQIAGDLLPAKTDDEWNRNLLATGFLAIGMKHHDEKNPRKFMSDMVDEQLDTTTQAVLGLTVACARCHDHKYDPIPTDDYYRLAGIFYSTKTFYGTARVAQNHRPSDLILLPVQEEVPSGASSGRGRRSQSREQMESQISELDGQMQGVRGKDRRELRNQRNRIATQLASLNSDGTPKSFGMGVQENDKVVNANILIGGEVDTPAQEVPRGFVQLFGDLDFTVNSPNSSGRLELAAALTSKDNPLTARVMMNRVWMHLTGKPLVETTSNFGYAGTEPTNPELLDYLAIRFMEEDWNLKTMIREIVMSDTYQRSSQYIHTNYEVDPDNNYNWRANPRTLDAEALRDAMLALSGRLNLERPRGTIGSGRTGARRSETNNVYRSVYLPIDRDNVPELLDLFDFADPNITSTGRSESIVPTQALYLMNGDFAATSAATMAARLEQNYNSQEAQMQAAFLLVYNQQPTSRELEAGSQFFQDFQPELARSPTASSSNVDGPSRRREGSGKRAGGRRGGKATQQAASGDRADSIGLVATQQTPLSVFCQTLMASAKFRILK